MAKGGGKAGRRGGKAGSPPAGTSDSPPAKGSGGEAYGDDDREIPFHKLRLWQIQAIRDVLVVAAVLAVLWLGHALSIVTVPLLVGLLLAYLCEPIVRLLTERLGWKRLHAVSALLLAGGLTLALVLAIVVPLVISQSLTLIRSFNDGSLRRQAERVTSMLPGPLAEETRGLLDLLPANESLPDFFVQEEPEDESDETDPAEADESGAEEGAAAEESEDEQGEAASDQSRPLTDEDVRRIVREMDRGAQQTRGVLSLAGGGFAMLWRIVSASLYFLLLASLIPFCFFFLSVWYPSVLEFGRRLLPTRHKDRTLELIVKMDGVVSGFVRGRIVICAITGVLLALGWFAMDVPYAFIFGLLTGLLFLVPYLAGVGWLGAMAASVFYKVGTGEAYGTWWLWALVWPSVWYGLVQLIESYFLTPKIAGKATNLDPVSVVMVVVAGGALAGAYGMLLAIPIAACGKILLVEVLFPKIDAWLKGERTDPLPFDRGD